MFQLIFIKIQYYQVSIGVKVENHFNRKTESEPQPEQIWSGWYNQFTEKKAQGRPTVKFL